MDAAQTNRQNGSRTPTVPVLIVTAVDDIVTHVQIAEVAANGNNSEEIISDDSMSEGTELNEDADERQLEIVVASEVANEEKRETDTDAVVPVAEEDKENEARPENNPDDHDDEDDPAIHYRINFRSRNRVLCDHLYVDQTTPVEELAQNPVDSLLKYKDGRETASQLQFYHELKDSTYKNKYTLQIDDFKMEFSERDDSILIRHDGDATVHMGTSSNTLFRNRNMATEELRNALKLNLKVVKSVFASNRTEQMGEVELGGFCNTLTAANLTVIMDSYQNVVEFIKLHKCPLVKLTVLCHDEYFGIADLEQVRTAQNLKLVGHSNISDSEILTLEAMNFEISSNCITSEGLNAYLKQRVAVGTVADSFMAIMDNFQGHWDPEVVLAGIDCKEYASDIVYKEINGSLPLNFFDGVLVYVELKSGDKIVVIIQKYFFQLFKEAKMPKALTHDYPDIIC